MNARVLVPVLALICFGSVSAQEPQEETLELVNPSGLAHHASISKPRKPRMTRIGDELSVKDDPIARREWMKERLGGEELTSEFRDAVLAEIAAVESVTPNLYKPGAVAPGAPGTWTNIGPVRSNWIQNGVRLAKSDTGRVRTIAVDPEDPVTVSLLTSCCGLCKSRFFLCTAPGW